MFDEARAAASHLLVARSDDGGRSFLDTVEIAPNNLNNQLGAPAVAADGTLVVPFHEISVGGEYLASPRLWVVRSTDGGGTFGLPRLVAEGFQADSPSSAVDRSGGSRHGRVYLGWMGLTPDHGQYLVHSDDSGSSWSPPARIDDVTDRAGLYPTHHPALAVNLSGILGASWFESAGETSDRSGD